ncbi:peptidase S8/S53 domain-containing protein [Linnemannia elongata]|nr:peptidase S8/S53 domain-containing protein [Linnemannia elongata]
MKITAILSALAAASLVSAGKFHSTKPGKANVVPGAYIIEYKDGISRSNAHDNLKKHAIDYKVRNEYDVFNGAAITVKSQHDGEALAAVPGVKNVWQVEIFSLPKNEKPAKNGSDVEAQSLHHMTGVDVLHKKYKLTGKGVKVGIIDTGIDYKHPAFAAPGATEGCFARYGKNCRVKYGWDFVGDDYNGATEPKPDSDPMDCQGHGSHVAGIVGGNALNIKTGPKPATPWVGVAPEVTFGAYRIFGCAGNAGTDVIMAAMEMAFNDGMDIINMSLGGGSSYKENPTAILGEKLIAHGMNLGGAAGNDGSEGVWMVSDTGLGETATSVASFDNAYGMYNTVSYAGATYPYSPSVATGNTPIALPATATLFPLLDKAGALQDGCDAAAYTGLDVKGKVVLLIGDFSRCGSVGRGNVAKSVGAAGALVVSVPFGLAGLTGADGLPMAAIENRAGEAMLAAYKKNAKNAFTWSKAPTNNQVEGGGAPSGFSSFGVDGELRSKPDIGAPGGNIYSSYPRAKGSYTLMSGTSMATPYYVGSQALYYQAKKSKPSGADARRAFKNTATIAKNWGSKTYASAVKQGAGLVNVLNAITATTAISPDRLDLLDTVNFRGVQKITIKNTGKKTETYTLSHVPADALNSYAKGNTFPEAVPTIEADYASVKFSANKVKIPAGKSVKVTLTFTEPKNGDAKHFPLYSGYVIATPSNEGSPAVHVPYIGLKGAVRDVPMIDTDIGAPGLASINAKGEIAEVATPATFAFNFNTAAPTIQLRYGSHSPDATIRVYDAKTNTFLGFVNSRIWGPAFGATGRMTTHDEDGNVNIRNYDWHGQVFKTEDATTTPVLLTAGSYNLVVASQKKLTKGAYPADFEIINLPTITVSA